MCEGRPPRHCGWAPFVRITACCFRESKGRAPVFGVAAGRCPCGEALLPVTGGAAGYIAAFVGKGPPAGTAAGGAQPFL